MAARHRPRERGGRATASAFLLPLCERCGGGMSLTVSEPHPSDGNLELRTYRCEQCGAQEDTSVPHSPKSAVAAR